MQDVNVVVVFSSGGEAVEQLALAAAVGAVQGRANIRLRHLPDAEGEYVPPRESDALWADAIIVGVPAEAETIPAEIQPYLASLTALREQGKLERKIGAAFIQGLSAAPLNSALCGAGLISMLVSLPIPMPVKADPDPLTAARIEGRRAAEAARSLRVSREAK